MQLFHKNNGKKSLLIFFSGWATDFHPFARLFSDEYDLLFVWDYRDTSFGFDFSPYDEIHAASFSYGVFMSQFVDLPPLKSNIAICGTLCPIDKEFGINPKMFDLTLNTLCEATLEKFYKNMFDTPDLYEKFLNAKNSGHIDIPALKLELENIKRLSALLLHGREFTHSIIAENDRIIPTRAQDNFWNGKTDIKYVKSGHFPFFQYTMDELLK